MICKKSLVVVSFMLYIVLMIVLFPRCSGNSEPVFATYEDTSASVYGPYRVIKLPVTKGIGILNPIQLALGPDDKLFAANQSGEVYTLIDSDGDGLEDEAFLYCDVSSFQLRSPSGFAFKGDTVYIGTAQEIRVFIDRDKNGIADTSWTFFNDIPYSQHPYEWTCGLNFGTDGWLYCALSTDSWNAGPSPDPQGYRGSILRISPDGKRVEKIATGIRSVYSMRFNHNNDLFFIDNEGGGNPTEELNHVVNGGFYGHNPKKYSGYDSAVKPVHSFDTEVAPAAMIFNPDSNDFGATAGDLFVAFYGSGERWNRGGVGRVKMEPVGDNRYRYTEYPVADIPKLSGIAFGKDGSLYLAHHGVSDYWYNPVEMKTGGFYKMIYDKELKNKPVKTRMKNADDLIPGSVEAGKQLFAVHACSACHAVDGKTELLGPNLKGTGKRLSHEEILVEIRSPSEIIKPSMGAIRITTNKGQVLLGRVVHADDNEISLMLIGNSIIKIPRTEISKTENENRSLMYEGLVNGLSEKEVNSLIDYIVSLE